MPTYHIQQSGNWWAIVLRVGAYSRHLPLMYATRDAAQRGVLALLGH